MPTYALLGATGSTGSAILRYLLEVPPKDLTLHILVRNKSKLLQQFPNLESSSIKPFPLQITEGTPDDAASLRQCLKDADVVFMCIATNQSVPGQSLAQDTTKSIIAALHNLRKDQSSIGQYTTPTILMLRTASLNKTFAAQAGFAKHLVHFCLHYVYADLQAACDDLESTARDHPGLLDFVLVDPPAIHDPQGTTRTGHRLELERNPSSTLMYADLGAGFVEVAERRREFRGLGVGVSATGVVNETWGILAGYLGMGLKSRIIG
ncbi:hypothetical protein B0A50_00345 [Salinomyces thailandicus]|uniref:NAD(P)-binding domain-containing protein n=1 Tax=Salinomyces thailandicus TaxID=706561 RepID=A0A4U0UFN0_9PEZI|nr:hypothetical protein B0A50_00345 [Salinomyces thailandica]